MSAASLIHDANSALLVHRRLDDLQAFFAEDYVAHVGGKAMKGHPWIRRAIGLLHGAFDDLSVDVEVLVEHDDRVAWQRVVRGTHVGAYAGFPATGATVTWRDMIVSRVEHGVFVEDWVVTDLAEQLLRARK